MSYRLIHLGGEHTVTGSCHLLQAQGLNILVDCGLAQGDEAPTPFNEWPVRPSEIAYLFLTHAHIDHIGCVPDLIEHGFSGEILCSHPSKMLLEPMLRDALGFQEREPEKIEQCLRAIEELCWGFEYRQTFSLKKGITFRLGCAGHIPCPFATRFLQIDDHACRLQGMAGCLSWDNRRWV